MSTASDYLGVAAIFALRAVNTSPGLPKTRLELADVVEGRYGWRIDEEATNKIVQKLRVWGFATIIDDRYAGELLTLYRAKSDEALEELAERGHQPLIANARSGGVDWFKKVFSNQTFWDDLHKDIIEDEPEVNAMAIDAEQGVNTDRLVTRLEDRIAVEVLEADLRGLVEEISTNNEISIELGDEKDVVVGELKATETLVAQPAFRSSRLAALALPVLRFLADKFAAGAIGELAKRLILAIIGLG